MAKTLEDTWAFVQIGSPFPSNPFRVKGNVNQFVALWYKHGKPTCGRAWNNGGVLECSFPYNKTELSGKRELGGEIQVLTYTGNYDTNGFLYNWVPYKERQADDNYQLVRCGNITPALIKCTNGEAMMGQIDMNTETASASYDGKAESMAGVPVQDTMVIVRNLTKPLAPVPVVLVFLTCPHRTGECPPLGDDGWVDLRTKLDKFPDCAVKALGRPLKMEDGSTQEQAVALWYKHGEPVMGRAYDRGVLAATFGWEGKEFSGDVGSVQVQCYHSKEEQGFELSWRRFKECRTEGWYPVHVKNVAPCVVITKSGGECLGKVFVDQEKASVAWGNKEEIFTGPSIHDFMVLCRNPPLII